MKRITMLFALVLCLPLAAHADDASMRAKAKELIELVHTDRMVEQGTSSIMGQVYAAGEGVVGPNPTFERQAKFDEFRKQVADKIDTELGWKAMEPAFIDTYIKIYTEDELNAIVAFMKSPAGAAYLEKTPQVTAQANKVIQSKMATLQPELRQEYADFQKAEAALPAPPAATPVTPAAPAAANPAPAKSPAPAASAPK
jgi:hypothetical protein